MISTLTPLEASIAARLASEAGAQAAATAVWLFGSRARGASTEDSDLDVAVEFASPETSGLRDWLERVRRELEEPIADQCPGFVNLVGLYADDGDARLARRIREEGVVLWRRRTESDEARSNVADRPGRPVGR